MGATPSESCPTIFYKNIYIYMYFSIYLFINLYLCIYIYIYALQPMGERAKEHCPIRRKIGKKCRDTTA